MSTRNYPIGYRVPRYNVLLISCMDLRLLDNIVHFMEHDNLTNRYDQFIMAGASIGALFETATSEDELNNDPKYHHWKTGLTDHLDLAIQLHDVKDIYIMEHRNCGAYKAFLKDELGNYDKHGYAIEFAHHKKYAKRLTELLTDYLLGKQSGMPDNSGSKYKDVIQIHSFIMDLRGDVELLHTTAPISEAEE
ncbi:hypothetical protein [Dyadobacter frigoris]|uniref:Carbonic anhydrase n=1 Tax=Dyadobacter frigoris TaxID=2576211 RepID=A0A4V6BMJ9_9BACT|nr:hypothetical protein [Dyadobacter frigoris]TKT94343.1 hypothetical protein FDK13_03795 [Dyadobacter frigoris]GLU56686.1 hypothetical protein Dfri01_61470 [Dyadobacter frigoris]